MARYGRRESPAMAFFRARGPPFLPSFKPNRTAVATFLKEFAACSISCEGETVSINE
jgi:hypothetical protein